MKNLHITVEEMEATNSQLKTELASFIESREKSSKNESVLEEDLLNAKRREAHLEESLKHLQNCMADHEYLKQSLLEAHGKCRILERNSERSTVRQGELEV
jgi:hypothetical protein